MSNTTRRADPAGSAGSRTDVPTDAAAGPTNELVISDLETLRVLADPMRMRIVESMTRDAGTEWTVKQLARSLEMTPTKLYYHVNLLEEHGLVMVTGSRIVSGIVEKRYRVAARSFRVDRTLLSPSGAAVDETLTTLVGSVFDAVRDEIEAAVRGGAVDISGDAPKERRLTLTRSVARLPADKARAFQERLLALISEFNDDTSGDETLGCGLLIAFYPMAPAKTSRSKRASRPAPASTTKGA